MAIPDYLLDPNAVLKDDAKWRYGRAPDYKKVNKAYDDQKTVKHAPNSLSWMVNNLVKNWEKEASFKLDAKEWRTIDQDNYKFKANDGPWLSAEDMLKLGTYNALIGESEFYSSKRSNFQESHKTFKRSLQVFSWEVLEIYSELPTVTFKWRHWGKHVGQFKTFARDGRQLVSDPTNDFVSITGMTVAHMSTDLKIISLEVFSDPAELFRQMTLKGVREVGESKSSSDDETEHVNSEDPSKFFAHTVDHVDISAVTGACQCPFVME